MKLRGSTLCDDLVPLDHAPPIIVASEDQASFGLIIGKPDFMLGDKPARVKCQEKTSKGAENARGFNTIRQSCVDEVGPEQII